LFSVARADHTALARPSGESSVNGFIEPVINHFAAILAFQARDIEPCQLPNAIAPTVPVADSVILLVPAQYIVPIVCPVAVTTILQVPFDDTTRDKSAIAFNIIGQVPTPLTHITGFAVLFSTLSEEATIYQAVLGSIQPE
jgi:hypothetical protein